MKTFSQKFQFLVAELNVYSAAHESHLKRDDFHKSDIQFTETSFRS